MGVQSRDGSEPVAEPRRAFLKQLLSAGACALPLVSAGARAAAGAGAQPGSKKQIAAIVYGYALRWHPDNIVTRLLEGYWINDEFHSPRCRIASLYTRIRPEIDLGRRLAGAYGFKGRTIDKPSELAPALEAAVREPGPYLLNVKVSNFENVYPMVPAGAALNEMVLGAPEPVAVPK